MDDFWDLEYGEEVQFEDIVEYVGPEEIRRQVEREISRLMARFVRGSAVKVEWTKGRCVKAVQEEGEDPNLWHCPGDTKPSAVAADYCFECPIRLQCLQFACTSGERYGTWGGVPENIRAGKGEGHDRDISAYDYEKLSLLPNVYDVTSRKYRYHRERLKDWKPGQEYLDMNFIKWLIPTEGSE